MLWQILGPIQVRRSLLEVTVLEVIGGGFSKEEFDRYKNSLIDRYKSSLTGKNINVPLSYELAGRLEYKENREFLFKLLSPLDRIFISTGLYLPV
jgi:hypothetical protein